MSDRKPAALTMEDVVFRHGELLVLERVSLEIAEGEFVAVVGPNGGGKTTLLKLLLGLLVPSEGRIRVLGESPERACARVGYMPQHLPLDASIPITVEEVVSLGRLRGGLHWSRLSREDKLAISRALERTGCAHLRAESFATLSGGQRQLVLIARALASDPKVLLLDEPTANLDPMVQDTFHQLLGELQGVITILLVSHDVGFVSRRASRVVCINRRLVTHPSSEVSGDLVRFLVGESHARVIDHDGENESHSQHRGSWR